MVLSLRHVAQMFNEIHDIGSIVHGILMKISTMSKYSIEREMTAPYPF